MFDEVVRSVAVSEPDRIAFIIFVVGQGVGSGFDGSDICGCEAQAGVVDGRSDIAESVTVYNGVDTDNATSDWILFCSSTGMGG
jgi:hypothetical protein